MDTRNSVDLLSMLLTWRTGVNHFKRDKHNYSFFQAMRVSHTGPEGQLPMDSRGFPASWSKNERQRLQMEQFCGTFESITCLPCNNPWIPARTQFIVSKYRIHAIPKYWFGHKQNNSIFSEYNWGLLFNCFIPYQAHKESMYPYLRCADTVKDKRIVPIF